MIFTLLALALAPGIAIILFIYLKDKHEKEPKELLLRAFLFGPTVETGRPGKSRQGRWPPWR
jgi:RsiW-degrading membrane proteinase PrsW (M82 family)